MGKSSVVAGRSGSDFGFAPAMSLSTRLIAINRLRRGERVGYAGAYECPEDMDVGVIAIGYGDGYPRSATAGTPVLIGAEHAAIVGRVSMDLVTIDLRDARSARVGDRVLLWGRSLPVERIAERAGTIAYEILTGLGQRYERQYR